MDPVQYTLVKVKSKLKCFLKENVIHLQMSTPNSLSGHVYLGYDMYTYQLPIQLHSIGFHTAVQYEKLYYEIA